MPKPTLNILIKIYICAKHFRFQNDQYFTEIISEMEISLRFKDFFPHSFEKKTNLLKLIFENYNQDSNDYASNCHHLLHI